MAVQSLYQTPTSNAVDTGLQSMSAATYSSLPVSKKAQLEFMSQQAPTYSTAKAPATTMPAPVASGGGGNSGNSSLNDYASAVSSLLNQVDFNGAANSAAATQSNLKNEQNDFAKWVSNETAGQASQAEGNANTYKGMSDAQISDLVGRTSDLLSSQQSSLDTSSAAQQEAMTQRLANQQSSVDMSSSAYEKAINALSSAMGRSSDGMFQQNLKTKWNADAEDRKLINEKNAGAAQSNFDQIVKEAQQAVNYRGEDFDYQITVSQQKADDEYRKQIEAAQAMAKAGVINYESAKAQIEQNYLNAMTQIQQMKNESSQAQGNIYASVLQTLGNIAQVQ